MIETQIKQNKIRLLQINAVYGVGSTGRNMLEIEKYTEENNFCVLSAYATPSEFAPNNGYQIGGIIDHKLHAFTSRVTGLQAYGSKLSTLKLIKRIELFRPDIIHLNNLHSNYIHLNTLLDYIANKNIPTVITLHDCWIYTGKCTHYTIDNCYKWQKNCGGCPRLKKDNPSWIFDFTKKSLKDKEIHFKKIPLLAVVGVSDWITNEAKKSILKDAAIIKRIYNWIDLNIFKPEAEGCFNVKQELGIPNDKFVIIGVASYWGSEKGIDCFIKLANELSKDKIIILVGKIPEFYNIPSNIINLSTNNIKKLAALYATSDLLINFSKEETFGKVTAEALASGTPALASSFTANPELIGKNCGYVIDVDNLEVVLKYINIVQKNGKSFYQTYCRDFAEKKFNNRKNIEEQVQLYRNLVELKNNA